MTTLMNGRAAALVLAAAVAVGCGGPAPVPALDGRADRQECAAAETNADTHCFSVTVTNRGAAGATGECWVAAILNYRTELARSDSVPFTDLGPDEVAEGDVTLVLERGADTPRPTFPVHCDPGGSG